MKLRLGRFFLALALSAFGATAVQAQLSQNFTANFDIPDLSQYAHQLVGSALFEDGVVVLTPPATGQNGGIFFDSLTDGGWGSLNISFDIYMSQPFNGGADGFGFAMLPTSSYGSSKSANNPAFSEEVNLPGTFGLGFDTFSNTDLGDPAAPDRSHESSVSVHWDGAVINQVDGNNPATPFNFESGGENGDNYNIQLFMTNSGSETNLTMVMTNIDSGEFFTPIINQVVPMSNYDYRLGFRARTGDAYNKQAFGNLIIEQDGNTITPVLSPIPPMTAELVGGTPYVGDTNHSNAGAAGDLQTNVGPGVHPAADGYFRVTQEVSSSYGTIAFDKVGPEKVRLAIGGRTGGAQDQYDIDNVSGTFEPGRASVNLDFRALGNDGTRADGLTIALLDTDDHGDSGVLSTPGGAALGYQAYEEGNVIPSSLGVSFDTFEGANDPGIGDLPPGYQGATVNVGNHVSVHLDGAQVGDNNVFPLSEFDIVNDAWNNVTLTATQINADQILVQLDIADGSDIAAANVESVSWIVNAPLGSVFNNIYVPEPTTGIMALSSLLLLGLRRRRG
jgi:hypothetical protein